jgi:Spy/CpxP family protein refolding chaperone
MGHGMHGGMMGHGMHHGMMYGQGMMGPLDLDEAQQKKLAKLQQSQAKQQWQLMQQLAQQRNELARLSSAENPDTQAISGAYDKVANLQKQMFMNNLETQKQFRELLTDEQQNTLKEMRQMGWDNW